MSPNELILSVISSRVNRLGLGGSQPRVYWGHKGSLSVLPEEIFVATVATAGSAKFLPMA